MMLSLSRACLALLLSINSASAFSCIINNAPAYKLTSDTVLWSMAIRGGDSCIRGVRTAFAILDSVELIAPPQSGRVTMEGPGFVYTAQASYTGTDTFTILVSGKMNRMAGSSTINVVVSVNNAPPTYRAAPRTLGAKPGN
jgi:hypothetical protein